MKVKHVNFEIELNGNGIVNFDSSEQKTLWNKENKNEKNNFTSSNENNMYAKKHFFRKNDGTLDYKIKISSDSLRNAIFKNDAIATNPSIMHHSILMNSFIGSTMGLVRGYMFANKQIILKRKSPLTVTSAIQTNNSVSWLEFHSRSGSKTNRDDSGTKDTTIFNKETIGDITYKANGFFDIQNIEFISADSVFDRQGFNSDEYEILEKFLKLNIPNYNSILGYYNLKTSNIDVAEYGIKLSSENVVFLIKETLKRILKINIKRAGAYAEISKLRVQLVTNPLNDSENKWIDIQSEADVDNLTFETEEFYVLSDETEAKRQRAIIQDALNKIADENKAAKEAAKAKRDAEKAKKEEGKRQKVESKKEEGNE